MKVIAGDAMIFAADPEQVTIFVQQKPQRPILIGPQGELSWRNWVDSSATPALAAAGWRLDYWHQPRNNSAVLATAFVWRI